MKPLRLATLLAIALLGGCEQTQPSVYANAVVAEYSDAAGVYIRPLRPGIWLQTSSYVTPGGDTTTSNGLIVRAGDALVLIDTAWGELNTIALLSAIESEIGLPVTRAVVTHAHYDRAGGVDVLESQGVEVLALPLTARILAHRGGPVPDQRLAGLDGPGAAIRLGSLELFYPGPGHSWDNLMVWLPRQRILFAGCAVRALNASGLGNTAHADLLSWQRAIQRAQARYPRVELVVPGHGAPGGPELLRHTLHLLREVLPLQSL